VTCIIKAMAVSYKVGRPYRRAAIDFAKDPDQELYDRFYAACRTLSCDDMVLLSRTLHVSFRAVCYWRVAKRFPITKGTAKLIISWVENGKPTELVTQAEAAAGMF
jgi:hypothetical protein